jgi:hypothetical protein
MSAFGGKADIPTVPLNVRYLLFFLIWSARAFIKSPVISNVAEINGSDG